MGCWVKRHPLVTFWLAFGAFVEATMALLGVR
jgi:hypothetical protein